MLKNRKAGIFVISMIAMIAIIPAGQAFAVWPDCHADVVAGFTPSAAASFGHSNMPDQVLGWPGYSGGGSGSMKVVSLGSGGSLILRTDQYLCSIRSL